MARESADVNQNADGFESRLRARLAEHIARRAERRTIQRWLRNNPPSLGRETGARI